MMKNKKGALLEEYSLKVIIAVICIILLLYLLFVFYSSFTNEQNFKRAEATLESLSEKMMDAKAGKVASPVTLPLLEPNSWLLISYLDEEKPEACTINCICLCADRIRDKISVWKNQVEKCSSVGVCKNFDENLNKFKIKIRTDVNIAYKNGGYEIIKVE